MNNLEDKIKKATDILSSDYVKDDFREITYEIILSHLLNKGSISNQNTVQKNGVSTNGKFNDWEKNVIENLPTAIQSAEGNRDQQTVWAVVKLYSRGDEATTHTVKEVIKDELGISPENDSNTSCRLKNLVPNHLTRIKEGKKYQYEPTRGALEIFEDN